MTIPLIQAMLNGNRRALARIISQVENDGPEARALLAELYPRTGQAHIVGITGAPGTGKSTLVNALAQLYRQQETPPKVGIIAVDPTSPFSGGALLGDRVRMQNMAGDRGVFIRSMATRGSLGGLARTTADVAMVLDAAGFSRILVETVGVGQAEVDIANMAHTTIVVEAPGLGDEIQAIKAGVLEIADIFAVNKADRDGVNRTVMALEMMLGSGMQVVSHHGRVMKVDTAAQTPAWRPPIVKTIALRHDGVSDLLQAIEQHRSYLWQAGQWQRREAERLRHVLLHVVQDEIMARFRRHVSEEQFQHVVAELLARRIDPYTAAEQLIDAVPQQR